MKKIMLCCSSGMSTSLLVKKMQEEANRRGLAAEIRAYGASEFEVQMPHYQVVLLGPQVKYMLPDLQVRAAEHGIPVDVINMMDYGMQRGDKVLDHALSLLA
ncbi:PTS sugar transporter subunit IIB [Pseudaeromonas sharmana]|uniref:PTS sugar transporter subunit IIB n=1 Tax=Pseudaeromonas sharmana TaxID=328412 RepID=A0ABV8CLF1_9GAMM